MGNTKWKGGRKGETLMIYDDATTDCKACGDSGRLAYELACMRMELLLMILPPAEFGFMKMDVDDDDEIRSNLSFLDDMIATNMIDSTCPTWH